MGESESELVFCGDYLLELLCVRDDGEQLRDGNVSTRVGGVGTTCNMSGSSNELGEWYVSRCGESIVY